MLQGMTQGMEEKDHFVFPFSVQNIIAWLLFSAALDEIWSSAALVEALQVCLQCSFIQY